MQKTSMTSNVHKSTQIFILGNMVNRGEWVTVAEKALSQKGKKCILHQCQKATVNDNIATFSPEGLFELKNSFQYSLQKFDRT